MPALNYAQKYQQALEQAYPYVLNFGALYATPNNGRFKWDGAKTILIPSLSTTGRVDANRDTIQTAVRNYDNAWVPKTLAFERKWSTLVHPMDIDETNMTATIANITQVFNETQKFPEMDAYTISKLFADWIASGMTADTTTPGVNNILTIWDNLIKAMDKNRVPKTGRVAYITADVGVYLKNTDKIQRNIVVDKNDGNIKREVRTLDGIELVQVPDELLKTAYDFTTGWTVGAAAKQINIAIVQTGTVITPHKYAFSQVDAPSAMSEGKHVYYEESYSDVFLLANKKAGVQFNVDA